MKSKLNVGTALVAAAVVVLVTGIFLHLKSHDVCGYYRGVIKVVHWVSGTLMSALACWHGAQFKKVFTAMRLKFRWFWVDTRLLIVLGILTVGTGLVKMLCPVKIAHLGLWHYAFGIAMTITIAVHLVRGIPGWLRMKKAVK